MTWDFFVMFLVILDSIILPFRLSFKHGMPDDAFDEMWFWFTTTVFFTDVSRGMRGRPFFRSFLLAKINELLTSKFDGGQTSLVSFKMHLHNLLVRFCFMFEQV